MAQLIKIGIPRAQWDKDRTKPWYSDIRVNKRRLKRKLSVYKPEAKKLLADMVEVRRAQNHGEIARNMSWAHFKRSALEESQTDQNPKTYSAKRKAFELIESETHLTEIKQLTPERLGRIKVALLQSGAYKPGAIVSAIRRMITLMRWAEDLRYVPLQNWRVVQKRNKEPAGRKDFFERQSYLSLLGKVPEPWFTAVLLMGRAGLRLGEALHLEWSDVIFQDANAGKISFRSKPHLVSRYNPKGWRIKKDSALNKVRSVPLLTSDIRQHLWAIRKPSGFVLDIANLKREEDIVGRAITRALRDAEIKTFFGKTGHAHILRHTFGSHMAQIGVPLKQIAEWMGHESVRMTEGYSHLCPHDPISNPDMIEKLCTVYVPLQNSVQPSTTIFSTLGPKSAPGTLSS